MATAKQLPSGTWRVQVWDKDSKKYLSFSGSTEDAANYAALQWKMTRDKKASAGITVGEAIDRYIDLNDGVLSPTTISHYRQIRKNNIQQLMPVPVKSLTRAIVQSAFTKEAARISDRTHRRISGKTLANARGLLSASLQMVDESIRFSINIPKTPKVIMELPEPETVIAAVHGTDVELPVLLAMWLSFSMSEIRGIQVSAIHDNTVTIKESVVQVEGIAVSKSATKAYERTRVHVLPDRIMKLIEQTDAWKAGTGYIETRSGKAVTSRFQRVVVKAGLPRMRFHDLRHLNASVMVMLGIPDKYAMERGGWKTKSTLNRVYQHTLSKERIAVDNRINEYFDSLF